MFFGISGLVPPDTRPSHRPPPVGGLSMGCDLCDEAESKLPKGVAWYIRVEAANVRIVACPYHAVKLMERINGRPFEHSPLIGTPNP